MARFSKVLAVALMAAPAAFAQTAVDPSDFLLLVPAMTAEMKAQFSPTDDKVAAFWDAWDGKDFMELTVGANAMLGRDMFEGDDDAKITIKAAADKNGLYFYCKVRDNIWVDPIAGSDANWQNDAVDLYFDAKSSDLIAGLPPEDFIYPDAPIMALTKGTCQINMNMGSTELPDNFVYRFYDPVYGTYLPEIVDFNTAAQTYNGMRIEVVKLNDNEKVQEWFIPWSRVGSNGGVAAVAAGEIKKGTRFAFSGGYNDLDSEAEFVNCLRWKGDDPWRGANMWGDIEIAEDISGLSVAAHPQSKIAAGRVVSVDYFTIQGQRLPVVNGKVVGVVPMMIQKTTYSNGFVATSRISAR